MYAVADDEQTDLTTTRPKSCVITDLSINIS